MKKLMVVALSAAMLLSLSACMGVRGRHGSTEICENEAFLGISIIEIVSPCKK